MRVLILVLFILSITVPARADLPCTLLWQADKVLKQQEHSLMRGWIVLTTNLLENMRRYGNVVIHEFHDEDDEKQICRRLKGRDSLAELLLLLFSSAKDKNMIGGKKVFFRDFVKNPETLAILTNHAWNYRRWYSDGQKINIEDIAAQIVATFDDIDLKTLHDLRQEALQIVNHIHQFIEAQIEHAKKISSGMNGKSFNISDTIYPNNFFEIMISALVIDIFNSKKELSTYLSKLDPSLIDEAELAKFRKDNVMPNHSAYDLRFILRGEEKTKHFMFNLFTKALDTNKGKLDALAFLVDRFDAGRFEQEFLVVAVGNLLKDFDWRDEQQNRQLSAIFFADNEFKNRLFLRNNGDKIKVAYLDKRKYFDYVGELPNLTSLRLYDEFLVNFTIENLPNLKYLSVQGPGALSCSVHNLPKLTVLEFRNVDIVGSPKLSMLPKLAKLKLHNANMPELDMADLSQELRTLDQNGGNIIYLRASKKSELYVRADLWPLPASGPCRCM